LFLPFFLASIAADATVVIIARSFASLRAFFLPAYI
jgi:hypothetical protein